MHQKKAVTSSEAPKPIGPYNQAISCAGFLFVSGQIALDSEGNLFTDEIQEETHRVMKNLKAILQESGMDFSHVVKTTIFLKDMGNFQKINEVYGSYLSDPFPARETVEVSELPKGVNVEISCMAYSNDPDYMN